MFKLVDANEESYTFFDETDETELILDSLTLNPLAAAKVINDQVLDFIPDWKQVVECIELIKEYEYEVFMSRAKI